MSQDIQNLAKRLGGDVYGGYAVLPGPGHSPRDRSLSIAVGRNGRVIYNSFCGDDDAAIRAYLGIEGAHEAGRPTSAQRVQMARIAEQARRVDQARKLRFCADVWKAAKPLAGTPAETYLRDVRGLASLPPTPTLRFHPEAPMGYGKGKVAPALVALVQNPNAAPCGLHVTVLRADGSGKACGDASRRMFGPVSGGAVRFSAAIPTMIALAEGNETALSYRAITGVMAWAALSTSGMKTFVPPPGVRRLIIAADGDAPGMDAAQTLARRLRRVCAVSIHPAPDGLDWNDVLMRGAS